MKIEEGTIEVVYNNQKQNPLHNCPTLQIISYQKIGSTSGEKFRCRANVSDGAYYMRAVFSSDITPLFDKDLISKYSLIKFDKFCIRSLKDSNYLYIQEIKEYEKCNVEIGRPVNYETGKASLNDITSNTESRFNNDEGYAKPNEIRNNGVTSNTESRFNNDERCNKKTKPNEICNNDVTSTENAKKQNLLNTTNSASDFTSINSINPFHNKWTIKGRIVLKSDIRKFSNKRGEGKLFSFEIADESGQIKIVAFSEVVDIFYPIIEVGKAYTIKKGQVKMSNKQFSSNNNDYEIHLDQTSEIELVSDNETPQFFFNFVKIRDISPATNTVDVIGVVKESFPVSTFIMKSTQKESLRRDFVLVDETGTIKATFWGTKAEDEIETDMVLAIKNIKVSDYGGVSLSSLHSSQVHKNPDIKESHSLLGWYNEVGKDIKIDLPEREVKISYISDVKNQEMPFSAVRATVMFFKEDTMMYESCKEEGCTKKVYKNEFGEYRCEKCDKTFYDCNYRYMISVNISDSTGQLWGTLFNDQAVLLFSLTSDQFREMAENDANQSQMFIKKFLYKDYIIKLRSRQDNYNDEVRMRYNISDIRPVNYAEEARKNILNIEKTMKVN
jgi:replication factor A1